jgi:hypothetical protein
VAFNGYMHKGSWEELPSLGGFVPTGVNIICYFKIT